MTSIHAFSDDALGRHDATTLGQMVAAGDTTSGELIDAAITRAEAVEPQLSAIAEAGFRQARDAASSATTGPFAGVPTFIKDMVNVAGLRTRFGTDALHAVAPAANDDPLVAQLKSTGLVPLGKTTMPEFGFTSSTEFPSGPPTRNPWNLGHTAGGSSGGAAALVAAGVVPIAHAVDGGGSTRIPASCCGLVGLKPTPGRLIASANTARQIVPIVCDGVLTRTVRDTALYFEQAERRFQSKKLAPIGTVDRPLDRQLNVAAIHDPGTGSQLDEANRRVFDASVELLESLGHRVDIVDAPVDDRFADDFMTLYKMLAAAALATGTKTLDPTFDRSRVTDFTVGLAAAFKEVRASAPGAVYRMRRSRRLFDTAFEGFDVALSPTVAHAPPLLGHLGMDLSYDVLFPRVAEWSCFTPFANATRTPSISLPLGHDASSNLPIGMLFGARYGQDRLLLKLALQLEAARPWTHLG